MLDMPIHANKQTVNTMSRPTLYVVISAGSITESGMLRRSTTVQKQPFV